MAQHELIAIEIYDHKHGLQYNMQQKAHDQALQNLLLSVSVRP